MKATAANQIQNIGVVGHGGEGKTTLVEAILFNAGLTDRIGKVEDGTTTTDYDPEETKRNISISAALAPIEWNSKKINFIDAPGYFDFYGEVVETLALADAALIVVGAVSGLVVGVEKMMDMTKKMKLPRMIVINQMDRENANFMNVFNQIKDKYGSSIVAIQLPIVEGGVFKGFCDIVSLKAMMFDGKKYKEAEIPAGLKATAEEMHDAIIEAASESDEELLEKYFAGETLSRDEIIKGLREGIASGGLTVVGCCAAQPNIGVNALLDNLSDYMPTADQAPAKACKDLKTGEQIKRSVTDDKFSAQVIKTVADPFVGKISLFKVYSGAITTDFAPFNANVGKAEKPGTLYMMRGKKLINVDKIIAGDIGAMAKLQYTMTGHTLCDQAAPVLIDELDFPKPAISLAVTAKNSGEEDKVFAGLNRLKEEDPTMALEKSAVTGDMLMSGLGEMHLDVLCQKLKNKFNVEAVLVEPKVPYRETIRKAVKAQGRHKKQSGGHGQFGDCWIEFEPIVDGSAEFEFVDKVVGGVVPRQFIPAVEKGLREAIVKGVLAGYPMVNLRCTLYDGSYHPVDSSEMAFKTAARIAYKKGCMEASPVLLEPINRYSVLIPDDYMGDVIGDFNRRRGRIMGMNPVDEGQEVVAEVPAAEMFKYATDLRSMTQGRGSFTWEFVRYEEVPGNISQKIIEQAKKDEEEEE
jgi:elongation factor G